MTQQQGITLANTCSFLFLIFTGLFTVQVAPSNEMFITIVTIMGIAGIIVAAFSGILEDEAGFSYPRCFATSLRNILYSVAALILIIRLIVIIPNTGIPAINEASTFLLYNGVLYALYFTLSIWAHKYLCKLVPHIGEKIISRTANFSAKPSTR